jgi:hypothetical protein
MDDAEAGKLVQSKMGKSRTMTFCIIERRPCNSWLIDFIGI